MGYQNRHTCFSSSKSKALLLLLLSISFLSGFSKSHPAPPTVWLNVFLVGSSLDPCICSGGGAWLKTNFKIGYKSSSNSTVEVHQYPVWGPAGVSISFSFSSDAPPKNGALVTVDSDCPTNPKVHCSGTAQIPAGWTSGQPITVVMHCTGC